MNFIKRLVVFILTLEARLVLLKYKPRIIAITGSVGKTSGKDAVFAALSEGLYVRKSEKSMNSDFGVPLTILGCETGWRSAGKWFLNILEGFRLIFLPTTYPEWLVLEVGADRPGDIRAIAQWLKPHIVIITAVPNIPAHVEYFDSVDAVLKEKRILAEYIEDGGSLILNQDDERVRAIKADFRGISIMFGRESTADFSASNEEIMYHAGRPTGLRFRINNRGASIPIELHGAIGVPRVYAALAASAAASAAGLDLVTAARGLSSYTPSPGRLRLLSGIKDTVIIDDTYNSSPEAAHAALFSLSEIQTKGRKIAVFGDMLELGRFSTEAHRELGRAAATFVDRLICVGLRARAIAEAARDAGMPDEAVLQYEANESERAGKELESELKPGDIILIKGSQGMRMERTVKEIMAAPLYAPDLLVRQSDEWLAKP